MDEDKKLLEFRERISTLKDTRALICKALDRFVSFVKQFSDNSKIYELQSRLEKTQSLWSEFSTINVELELTDFKINHALEREMFEDKFFEFTGIAKGILDNYFTKSSTLQMPSQVGTGINASNNTNLPKIKLPEFSGAYDQWMQFADTFKSLIHNHQTMSNVEKFWYLKSCIKGDAANSLASLEVSELNYNKAWNILCERYQNRKIIIQTHLKAIFETASIAKESYTSLRNLIDTTIQHLRALESLGLPVNSWDTLIIYHISSKLDLITRREWEDFSIKLPSDTPSLADLTSFLTKRCQMLENISSIHQTSTSIPHKSSFKGNRDVSSQHTRTFTTVEPFCILCKNSHYIFTCPDFLKLTPQERLNETRRLKACANCLRAGHAAKDCRNTSTCKKCSNKHNSLLHFPSSNPIHNKHASKPMQSPPNSNANPELANNANPMNNNSQSLSVTQSICNKNPYILLSTANVIVFDSTGNPHNCRALLDNCSQSNFLTESLYNKLNIPSQNISHTVEGFGNNITKIFKSTTIKIKSMVNTFALSDISCLITRQITRQLPDISFNATNLQIPQNIKLADCNFNQQGPVDMLIGAPIFWSLICVGQIKLANQSTILQKTKLGWILSGPLDLNLANISSCNLSIDTSSSDIQNQLEQFWKIEEYPQKTFNSKEEDECEKHFIQNTIRHKSGRFIVSLPFKDNISELGSSFDTALRRFYSLEKRLANNQLLKDFYHDFIAEYQNLGHMSMIVDDSLTSMENSQFFLPHHGVYKESSSTTKLRVVFDGSCKTTTGLSLNDTLKVGPKIQDDLIDIIIRFRTHTYAFTADVEKMYRCVLINKKDRPFQKILWRSDPSQPVQQYHLNTITYGTSSAAFLAVRCLHQIAIEHKDQYPLAAEAIMSSFYVDDLLTGTNCIQKSKTLISQISEILKTVGFNLRKWASNEPSVLTDLSQDPSNSKIISDNDVAKTLGLTWNAKEDTFQYTVQITQHGNTTKRSILAATAQIFDPLGLLGPCIIKAKIILQELWQLGLDWDESVPMDLHNSWNQLSAQLPILNCIKIPRHIIIPHSIKIEFHGFSDASQRAYGACCYLRSSDNFSNNQISLICAKSRVAPLKTLSLPRLELCAALLLVRLAQKLLTSLKIDISQSYFWTDSTIVLSWIALQPNQLNTFVANRVAEIQQNTLLDQWHHVASENNPADIISRGLEPEKLKDCQLWWHGPKFFTQKKEQWPELFIESSSVLPEIKTSNKTTTMVQTTVKFNNKLFNIEFMERYSSFTKLQRIVAYFFRFTRNILAIPNNHARLSGPLTKEELNNAIIILCKIVQSHYFPSEIKLLLCSRPLPTNNNISRLNPFLENELIRVGGRLKFSDFSFNQCHPILLPSEAHLTKLIIRYEHLRHLHAGSQATLASVRLNFWPINGRHTTQKLLRKCTTCFKVNPTIASYQMGNLPKQRVTPQRPFFISGIDYAGPFLVKDGKAKNRTLVKCYLCIFVCFASKAVHFELAGDLSSESFLNCLKRFTSRRGICSEMYSDNGTNFVGADNELKLIVNQIKKDLKFKEYLSINNIKWHFSPPSRPTFGGLWEAAVKSAKFHLKRIVGNSHLTYESLNTIFVQIEAVMNSRPLFPLSSDPNDLNALTPSHFLIGEPLTSLPQADIRDVPDNRLKHYKRLQQQVQHFWQRWSLYYIGLLQERSKWNKSYPNLKVGVLVIIKDDNAPPLCWKLGRISEVFPGSDDIVRVVNVKTNNGIIKRPVNKLCPLPIET